MVDLDSHRLVFVGGLHRSGTTLLARCLAEHPQVSGFEETGVPADEGQHLQSVYPTARAHGGPGRFALSAGAHLTEASSLATAASREQLLEDWGPHWNLGRPVLLEKSPPNILRTRFLQAVFPEASFVMIFRHPVAVSLATQKWSKTSLAGLMRHWLVAHRTFERDRPHLERVLVVSYEHLIARTQECLDAVYAFLGLDSHPTTLATRPDGNEPYFERWRRLNPLYRRLLEWRFERQVAGFGYSLVDLGRSLSSGSGT